MVGRSELGGRRSGGRSSEVGRSEVGARRSGGRSSEVGRSSRELAGFLAYVERAFFGRRWKNAQRRATRSASVGFSTAEVAKCTRNRYDCWPVCDSPPLRWKIAHAPPLTPVSVHFSAAARLSEFDVRCLRSVQRSASRGRYLARTCSKAASRSMCCSLPRSTRRPGPRDPSRSSKLGSRIERPPPTLARSPAEARQAEAGRWRGGRSSELGIRSSAPGARSPEFGARSSELGARSPESGARNLDHAHSERKKKGEYPQSNHLDVARLPLTVFENNSSYRQAGP